MLSACAKWKYSSMYGGREAYLDLVFKQQWAFLPNWNPWGRDCLWTTSYQLQTSSQTTEKANRPSTSIPYAYSPASSTFTTERNMLKTTTSGKLSRTQPHSVDWVTVVCNTKLIPDSRVKLCWHQKVKSESYLLLAIVFHASTEMKIKSKNIW